MNALGSSTDFDGTEATTKAVDAAPFTIISVFSGLAAGDHPVSLWTRGAGAGTCFSNTGNFSHRLIAEEGS